MGVVLASLGISSAIGLGLSLSLNWPIGWLNGPSILKKIGAVLGVVVACSVFFFVLGWLAESTTTTKIAMNSREGESALDYLGLPAGTTSDFCYRYSLANHSTMADFNMSEADFLHWMKSQNWRAVKFDHGTNRWMQIPWVINGEKWGVSAFVYPVRQYDSKATVIVRRGYCYFDVDERHDSLTITYDLDSGRAYINK